MSRLAELRVLNRITQTVADERDLHRALHVVSAEMLSIFDVRTAAVALLDRDLRTVSTTADSTVDGAVAPPLRGRVLRVDDSPALQRLVAGPAPMALSGAEDPGVGTELGRILAERGAHGLLVVPLQLRSEIIGALLLETDRPGRSFSTAEISLAETVAGQITGAIENARLFEEMVDYVEQVDHVTGAAGAMEAGTFHPDCLDQVGGREDALGQLARVFQRMAREVAAREQRLRQEVRQLRIEIDDARTDRQVEEITESDYFRRLQEKAEQLRIASRP
ncbi:MAG: GAF domain-containing protein [Acidimicrobiales bacterium]